jgi:hypothetical protein
LKYIMSTNVHYSQVSGGGLFASWRRNFQSRKLALLDLLDNAVDAAADLTDSNKQHRGRISLAVDGEQLVLTNSCIEPIPAIPLVLNVFCSNKQQSQQIGQNGVGIKQACASLARLSWILTRSHNVYSIGIITEDLQSAVSTPVILSIKLQDTSEVSLQEQILELETKASELESVLT